jgi:5-methylthioadenosine/S-adenosylhomocysteine deaminase
MNHKMWVAPFDSLKFCADHPGAQCGSPDEIKAAAAARCDLDQPESNMKLASGTAPVLAYRAAGNNVGIGTDGAASNNDLDMFEAMRQTAFQQKLISMDPRVISAPEALEMATIGGARALGQQAKIGSLEVGKLADLIVVNMDRPRQLPLYDVVSQIVYVTRGDDVDTTIVNGKVLMRGRKMLTLDEAKVIAAANAAAAQVRKAVGLP